MVKNLPAKAGDSRDAGSVPGGGHDSPLWYSCWENATGSRLQSMGPHRVRHDGASENGLFRLGQVASARLAEPAKTQGLGHRSGL